jgi:predicted nucleic acid-binding protein
MAGVLVDSNVLLDVVTRDVRWSAWSEAAISRYAGISPLIINAVIFAEVSVRYSSLEEADIAFSPSLFRRENIPYQAAFLAGKAYALYRKRKGTKPSALPDFFIGAHAAVAGYAILTRDPARYRFYYPGVKMIAPE